MQAQDSTPQSPELLGRHCRGRNFHILSVDLQKADWRYRGWVELVGVGVSWCWAERPRKSVDVVICTYLYFKDMAFQSIHYGKDGVASGSSGPHKFHKCPPSTFISNILGYSGVIARERCLERSSVHEECWGISESLEGHFACQSCGALWISRLPPPYESDSYHGPH